MGMRAEPSGLELTAEDAALIRGMIHRGDPHHDIAAFFGVNPGRIADIKFGVLHPGIEPADPGNCRRRAVSGFQNGTAGKPAALTAGFPTGAEAPLDVTLNTTILAGPFTKINDLAPRTGHVRERSPPMADYRIDYINKPDRNSAHEHITHVGGPNPSGTGRWRHTVPNVVSMIETENPPNLHERGRRLGMGPREDKRCGPEVPPDVCGWGLERQSPGAEGMRLSSWHWQHCPHASARGSSCN